MINIKEHSNVQKQLTNGAKTQRYQQNRKIMAPNTPRDNMKPLYTKQSDTKSDKVITKNQEVPKPNTKNFFSNLSTNYIEKKPEIFKKTLNKSHSTATIEAIEKNPEVPKPKPKISTNPIKKPVVPLEKKKPVVVDPIVEQLILRNIDVSFDDIVGLVEAKSILQEAVIRPRQRPDLYTGIRAPPRALLLYGPPGNGKTFLCKALAHRSKCTFIALSASSILNKFLGQSEKTLVKIFNEARKLSPTIIFIDEIDSMLTARSEKEHEASRRLKNEFFVQLEGVRTSSSEQVLVIGATNLPKELDSAAKRRFSKFIYIGNPDQKARKQMLLRHLKGVQFELTLQDIDLIVQRLQYFSASEIRNIVAEASMLPLREVSNSNLKGVSKEQIRKINVKDFILVINERKPIVSKEQLEHYKEKV